MKILYWHSPKVNEWIKSHCKFEEWQILKIAHAYMVDHQYSLFMIAGLSQAGFLSDRDYEVRE